MGESREKNEVLKAKSLDRDQNGRFAHGTLIRRAYPTFSKFKRKADEYFDLLKSNKDLVPGVAGLASHLGVSARTISNYRKYGDKYAEVIDKCLMIIEADHEQRLLTGKGNVVGTIFSLKNNFGYADKQEISMQTQNLTLTGFQLINPNDETSD